MFCKSVLFLALVYTALLSYTEIKFQSIEVCYNLPVTPVMSTTSRFKCTIPFLYNRVSYTSTYRPYSQTLNAHLRMLEVFLLYSSFLHVSIYQLPMIMFFIGGLFNKQQFKFCLDITFVLV